MRFDGRFLSNGRFLVDTGTLPAALSGKRYNEFVREDQPFLIKRNDTGERVILRGVEAPELERMQQEWEALDPASAHPVQPGYTAPANIGGRQYIVRTFHAGAPPTGVFARLLGHGPEGVIIDQAVYAPFETALLKWSAVLPDGPLFGMASSGAVAAVLIPLQIEAGQKRAILKETYRQ